MQTHVDARILEKEIQRIQRAKTPGRLVAALKDNAQALRGKPLPEAVTPVEPDYTDPGAVDALLANLKTSPQAGPDPAAMHALDPDRVAALLDLK